MARKPKNTIKKQEDSTIKILSPEAVEDKPLCPMSGSRYEEVRQVVFRQIAGTIWAKHSDTETINQQMVAAMALAMGVQPQDELEGMLAAQMVAAHNASMECFRRAMHPEQSLEGRNMNLAQANKLSRSYAAMMEALNRYRGKGQQKMTVEHVTVNSGGQAIVGTVNRSKGGREQKIKEQPHVPEK